MNRPEPHAIRRARERYGIELTLPSLDALAAKINAKNLMRRNTTSNVHVLLHDGVYVVVAVTHEERPKIATFLPPDYFTAGHARLHARTRRETAGGRMRRKRKR